MDLCFLVHFYLQLAELVINLQKIEQRNALYRINRSYKGA